MAACTLVRILVALFGLTAAVVLLKSLTLLVELHLQLGQLLLVLLLLFGAHEGFILAELLDQLLAFLFQLLQLTHARLEFTFQLGCNGFTLGQLLEDFAHIDHGDLGLSEGRTHAGSHQCKAQTSYFQRFIHTYSLFPHGEGYLIYPIMQAALGPSCYLVRHAYRASHH